LGFDVRGDLVVDPHGGPHGTASVDGKVSQYPTWDAYSSKPGQPPTTVLEREQNLGVTPIGPFGLVLPNAPVGQHPEAIDEWHARYHPDQVAMHQFKEDYRNLDPGLDSPVLPLFEVTGGEFSDYPLDPLPPPIPDGKGGLEVPEARHVG
jgi:hypothetical protein